MEINPQQKQRTQAIYWLCTGLFSLLMLLSSVSDLFQVEQATRIMAHLGFPLYLMRFIGIAKFLGLIVLVLPQFSRLKEWAYAGFVFNLTGGCYAHLCLNDPASEWARPLVFLLLLVGSYFLYQSRLTFNQLPAYAA